MLESKPLPKWIYFTYSPRDSQIDGSSYGRALSIWLLNSNLDLGLVRSAATTLFSRSCRLNWNSTTLWNFLEELTCFRFWFNARGSRLCLRDFLSLEVDFWTFEEADDTISFWPTELLSSKLKLSCTPSWKLSVQRTAAKLRNLEKQQVENWKKRN